MQCHHIIQEADGGPDTFDNCIPLCPDCHAEVQAFNPHHPFGGTPYHSDELKRRRDDWYATVGRRSAALSLDVHRRPENYPHEPASRGRMSFDYSYHDGFFGLGQGSYEFLTHWSSGSNSSIHLFTDDTNVSIALARKGAALREISQASLLHYGSRVQTPQLNQIAVLENGFSRYAAIKIARVKATSHGDDANFLIADYWILEDGSDDFSGIE